MDDTVSQAQWTRFALSLSSLSLGTDSKQLEKVKLCDYTTLQQQGLTS